MVKFLVLQMLFLSSSYFLVWRSSNSSNPRFESQMFSFLVLGSRRGWNRMLGCHYWVIAIDIDTDFGRSIAGLLPGSSVYPTWTGSRTLEERSPTRSHLAGSHPGDHPRSLFCGPPAKPENAACWLLNTSRASKASKILVTIRTTPCQQAIIRLHAIMNAIVWRILNIGDRPSM